MKLPHDGREFAHWPVSGVPDDLALEVSFDAEVTWNPTTRAPGLASALLAGPGATANPGGTVILSAGVHPVRIRAADNPELVIRDAGIILVG